MDGDGDNIKSQSSYIKEYNMKNIITSAIKNINLKREVRAYSKYVSLNVARKATEGGGNAIFRKLDDLRRQVGYVK